MDIADLRELNADPGEGKAESQLVCDMWLSAVLRSSGHIPPGGWAMNRANKSDL